MSDLYYASALGKLDEVRRYIARGDDVNNRVNGSTPLHEAKEPKIAEALIMAGANIEARDKKGNTPLMKAALSCRTEATGVLLDHGANINATNENGQDSMSLCSGGHRYTKEPFFHILRDEIAKRGRQPSPQDLRIEELEKSLSEYRNKETLKEQGDPDMTYFSYDSLKYGGTPLHEAASIGDRDEMKRLIFEEHVDINSLDKYGNNILHTILLLRFDDDYGKGMFQCTNNRMLTHRRKLHHGRMNMILDEIKFMLHPTNGLFYLNGVNMETKNIYGRSPLYYAADYYGDPCGRKIFEYLLKEVTDIHLIDNKRGEFGNILNMLDHYIKTSKKCETGKLDMEKELEKMETEVSEITSKMSIIEGKSRIHERTMNSLKETNNILQDNTDGLEVKINESGKKLAKCIERSDDINDLLEKAESLLETRNRTIRACESQKLELEQDVASISARLLMENSELSDDVIEARDRLRLALEDAARNSNSVQLGTLIKEMSDFMNSGDMNNYQLSVMESIMEENIRQATSPERIELLGIIFVKIKDEVRDKKTTIKALKELESNEFTVGVFTKIGAHLRLF